RLPFYGTAVLCIDDANVREILPFISKPVITYGFSAEAQWRAVDARAEGTAMHFTVKREGATPLTVRLNLPGRHNVLNATAAVAVGSLLGVSDAAVLEALASFTGVGRRFARLGDVALEDGGSFTLIDDYGHHPVEMAATIEAARGA